NGARDAGEAGIGGAFFYLLQNGGAQAFASTDASGNGAFPTLRPGTYDLVRLPQGSVVTTPIADSYTVTLASGQSAGPYLFGIVRQAVVSGAVFNDADRDGTQSAGEGGLSGRLVYADLNNNGVRDVTTLTINATNLPDTVGDVSRFNLDIPRFNLSTITDVNVSLDLMQSHASAQLLRPLVRGV